jgi:hypothetical protein
MMHYFPRGPGGALPPVLPHLNFSLMLYICSPLSEIQNNIFSTYMYMYIIRMF